MRDGNRREEEEKRKRRRLGWKMDGEDGRRVLGRKRIDQEKREDKIRI